MWDFRELGISKALWVDGKDVMEGEGGGGRGGRGGKRTSPASPLPTCLSRPQQPSVSKHLSNLAPHLLQDTLELTKSQKDSESAQKGGFLMNSRTFQSGAPWAKRTPVHILENPEGQ